MLIICSGPDTYRAREKAKELQVAFRTKHDRHGLASEVIDGSLGITALLSRLASASLFSQKKFIRADGCLAKMKIAEVRALAARLEIDRDQTIILTVEEQMPAAKMLETLKIAPLFHYPFDWQKGIAFKNWVNQQAAKKGVSVKVADQIARNTDGDSWFAMQELAKQEANVNTESSFGEKQSHFSVFDVADAVLDQPTEWRKMLNEDADDGVLAVTLNQVRSYLRVRDGAEGDLHPYVVKKLRGTRLKDPERCGQLYRAFLASRSGLASGAEVDAII